MTTLGIVCIFRCVKPIGPKSAPVANLATQAKGQGARDLKSQIKPVAPSFNPGPSKFNPTQAASTVAHQKGGAALALRGLQSGQKPASFLGNNTMIDAADFATLTGIEPASEEVHRLDTKVKKIAEDIGLNHKVGFQTECSFCGYTDFAFIATFKAWERPDQEILVGLGILSNQESDLAAFGDVLPSFQQVAYDFLALSEDERIQAVLVHEKIELEAAKEGVSDPHRYAVANSPKTDMAISSRVREHLELYARTDRACYGAL